MSGCTSVAQADTNDPYEKFNRSMFAFNRSLDKHVVKPIATAYNTMVPIKLQKHVGHFFNNLNLLPTIANDILQANLSQGLSDTARFCFNSTIGIFGLFDATEILHLNLPSHHQDLGLTLAKYGAHESPFIMMPLFGPKTVREVVAMPITMTTLAPLGYLDNNRVSYGLQVLEVINHRTYLLPTDKLINESLDPYIFVRNAYLQNRNHSIGILSHQTEKLAPDSDEDDLEDLDQDSDISKIEENEEAFMDELEDGAFKLSYSHYRSHYHPASTFHQKDHSKKVKTAPRKSESH